MKYITLRQLLAIGVFITILPGFIMVIIGVAELLDRDMHIIFSTAITVIGAVGILAAALFIRKIENSTNNKLNEQPLKKYII